MSLPLFKRRRRPTQEMNALSKGTRQALMADAQPCTAAQVGSFYKGGRWAMAQFLIDDAIPLVRPDGNMRTLAEIEAAAIDYALNTCTSRGSAAAALGIGRSTLHRKMTEPS